MRFWCLSRRAVGAGFSAFVVLFIPPYDRSKTDEAAEGNGAETWLDGWNDTDDGSQVGYWSDAIGSTSVRESIPTSVPD
jgi:hypothetical protein